jgi:hypothetical protein
MKRIFLFISLVFFVCFPFLLVPSAVYSASCIQQYDTTCPENYVRSDLSNCPSASSSMTCCCPRSLGSNEIPNPTALESIGDLITKASSLIPPFAILGFVGSVIYAGFVRMTAAGNPEKEAKSMKIAIAAAIGFAIIALAPLLVNLISGFLNVEDPLA